MRQLYLRWLVVKPWIRAVAMLAFIAVILTFFRTISLLGEFLIAAFFVDTYIGSRVKKDEPLAEIGLPRPEVRPILAGVACTVTLISATIAVLAAAGWYHVVHFTLTGRTITNLGYWFLTFIFAAAVEEILDRGMIWGAIERRWGSWIALFGSSLFFGLGHLANPHASLRAALAIASEAGLLFGAIYLLTRSLWVLIAAHMAWNLFEGPVYGTMVSGLHQDSLIHSVTHGPTIWTGGSFGPEAGLVCMIGGTSVAVVLLAIAARSGKILPRPPKMVATEASPAAS
jgi:membrane protease YdiL (CAAX protease family)